MGQNLEVLVPELASVFRIGFQAMTSVMQAMQSQVITSNEQVIQSQAEFKNTLADSFMNVASLLRQPGHVNQVNNSVTATIETIITTNTTNNNATTDNTNIEQVDGIVQYKMNRHIVNINGVWREYATGLSGSPSVKTMEQEHKAKWRKNRTESKFFNTRSVIYKEVEKIANERSISCEEAAQILETRRTELGASIDKLIKTIKNNTT